MVSLSPPPLFSIIYGRVVLLKSLAQWYYTNEGLCTHDIIMSSQLSVQWNVCELCRPGREADTSVFNSMPSSGTSQSGPDVLFSVMSKDTHRYANTEDGILRNLVKIHVSLSLATACNKSMSMPFLRSSNFEDRNFWCIFISPQTGWKEDHCLIRTLKYTCCPFPQRKGNLELLWGRAGCGQRARKHLDNTTEI